MEGKRVSSAGNGYRNTIPDRRLTASWTRRLALGVARAMTDDRRIGEIILGVQKDLLTMGAELSSLPGDIPKPRVRIGAADAQRLEDLIDELQVVKLKKISSTPG